MEDNTVQHAQVYHANCGWTLADLIFEPSALDGLTRNETFDGDLIVTVEGPKIRALAGVWDELRAWVSPWAQISLTGEVLYVSGVPRGASPDEVFSEITKWIEAARRVAPLNA